MVRLPAKPVNDVASMLVLRKGPATDVTPAQPATLTSAENAAGWKSLFHGQSTQSWRAYKGADFPAKQWTIDDGNLKCLGTVEGENGTTDVVTREQYGDFELTLEFKTSPHANSGIMYRVTEIHDASWQTGPEFQILDDAGSNVRATDAHSCGGLYDILPPDAAKVLKPVGEYNAARIRLS